jgi:hypothetical protein
VCEIANAVCYFRVGQINKTYVHTTVILLSPAQNQICYQMASCVSLEKKIDYGGKGNLPEVEERIQNEKVKYV